MDKDKYQDKGEDIDNKKDSELSDLIKDTLAGYEEDYVAGAWENFTNKRRILRNKRKKVVFMRYAAGVAACLILGLIWLNGYNIGHPSEPISSEKTVQKIALTDDSSYEALSNNNNLQIADKILKSTIKTKTSNNFLSELKRKKVEKEIANIKENPKEVNKANEIPIDVINSPDTSTNKTIQIAKNETEQTQSATQQLNSTKPEKTNLFGKIKPSDNFEQSETIKTRQSARKVRFGINVAQGVNSTSTASAYNYSGGVNIDIPIWGKLTVSTGLQIEHQDVMSKKSDGIAAIPSDIKRASLLNFDFPLNLKWRIFSRKSYSYYISGGISSLAYLSEKYTTTSQRQELRETAMMVGEGEAKTYKLENVETTTSVFPSESNPFDIAGRLNIGIGYEKQISRVLYLHVEPFMKIPLSGLANENLRFVTSGIIFKVSF